MEKVSFHPFPGLHEILGQTHPTPCAFPRALERCALIALLFFFLCPLAQAQPQTTVLLISLDGFRWDYQDRFETPNLDRIAREGGRAKWMTPVFPSKTFPSHYSMVTGLYPEKHGIVSNKFQDPVLLDEFEMGDKKDKTDGRWWGGEPIWITAEKQGLKTAPFFWVGAEATIKGVRPTFSAPYDGRVSNKKRVDRVLELLDLPVEERPSFLTLYFSQVDTAGHNYGPDSEKIRESAESVDRSLGQLLGGLEERGLLDKIDVLVVSDHGMTALNPDKVVYLDDFIDLKQVEIEEWTPVLSLTPDPGKEAEVYRALKKASPHLHIYRKEEIPERFHYRDNPRIAPIIGIADEGWTISHRGLSGILAHTMKKGAHGYDNQLESMRAVFLAKGPEFKTGATLEPFECVHLYALMAHLLGIQPAPNEGDLSVFSPALVSTP